MDFSKILVTFVCLLPLTLSARPIVSPSTSAGVVEREVEKEYEVEKIQPETPLPLLESDLPSPEVDTGEAPGKAIKVTMFRFQGNTVFSSQQLECFTDPKIGSELFIKEIQGICQKIKWMYVKAGYFLAQVFLPQQRVREGIVTIRILEGRLGGVHVEGNRYYSSKFIEGHFNKLKGRPLRHYELMKALILLSENSDLVTAGILNKGKEVGEVDLIIRVKDDRPIHLYLNYNDYGNRATSSNRIGGRFDWGNSFAYGDTLSLAGVLGIPFKDLQFVDGIYKFPLNYLGTRLEVSYLYAHFDVSQLESLQMSGQSNVASLKVTHPLTRTRALATNGYLAFDYKDLKNYALGTAVSSDNLRVFRGGVTADYKDRYLGRNVSDLEIAVGAPNFLGGSKVVDPKSSRVGAGGEFVIFSGDYTRFQVLPRKDMIYFNVTGQYSWYKLPLAEQIYIGGVDTVRGYPMAAALGDSGYYFNIEYQYMLWKNYVQLVAFFDHGGVFLRGGGEGQGKSTFLTGIGPGFRVRAPKRLDISLDIGIPLTSNFKTLPVQFYVKVDWRPF